MAEGLTRASLRAGSPVGHLTGAVCQGHGGETRDRRMWEGTEHASGATPTALSVPGDQAEEGVGGRSTGWGNKVKRDKHN